MELPISDRQEARIGRSDWLDWHRESPSWFAVARVCNSKPWPYSYGQLFGFRRFSDWWWMHRYQLSSWMTHLLGLDWILSSLTVYLLEAYQPCSSWLFTASYFLGCFPFVEVRQGGSTARCHPFCHTFLAMYSQDYCLWVHSFWDRHFAWNESWEIFDLMQPITTLQTRYCLDSSSRAPGAPQL